MTAYTKPFDLDSARAGAPLACRDGQSVEILKWDLAGRKPLLGLVGDLQRPVTWSADGKFTLYRDDALDLVCLLKQAQQPGSAPFDYCDKCGGSGEMHVLAGRPPDDYWDSTASCDQCSGTGASLAHPVAVDAPTCKWTLDDWESGTWKSSCGELWGFNDGGPQENRVSYCHHCGDKVAINAQDGEAT